MVASDDITLFIYTQTMVTVIGKTNVQAFLYNELLQSLDMSRACIVIDIQAIRLVVDYIGVCDECVKNGFCNVLGATIGAVQTNLDTLEEIDTQRDQITH